MTKANSSLSGYLNPLPERPTVIETLTRQILALIRDANLQPGDRLPSEMEMIAVTNASRPSVREALRALKTMGVIETRPGAGSFVRKAEPVDFIRPELISLVLMGEDVIDMLEARRVLECEAARLAAQRPADELAQLEPLLDEMSASLGEPQRLYETTWAFHTTLTEIAANPVIGKLVRILYEMIRALQLKLYWPHIDAQEQVEIHTRLYAALQRGPGEAEREMCRHLDEVSEVVEKAIEDRAESGAHSAD